MKKLRFFCLLLLFCSGKVVLAQSDLIVLPLPFYAKNSGWGLALKGLHPNLGHNFYLDFAGYATEKSRYGLFSTIGQKQIPFAPWLFWSAKFQASKQLRDFYGVGNQLPVETEASYHLDRFSSSQRLGVMVGPLIKVHALHLYSYDSITKFRDPEELYSDFWTEVSPRKFKFSALGGGIELGRYDSEVRPKSGAKLSYEYYDSYAGDVNLQHHQFSWAQLLPFADWWSHGIHLYYEAYSGDSVFSQNPDIWVRGIEASRHNGKRSMALHQETRLYVSENLLFTPFFDVGRVFEDGQGHTLNQLHHGYGIGLRYIYRQALVLRLDVGFAPNNESDIVFNYQHSF